MKFGVLALDYDVTIARDGALDPGVRAAISEARARGIVSWVFLRREILSEQAGYGRPELCRRRRRGENGAVLWFPNGYSKATGVPHPLGFWRAKARGLEFKAGQCVVEHDAATAPRVLNIIRALGKLPLVLFNAGDSCCYHER